MCRIMYVQGGGLSSPFTILTRARARGRKGEREGRREDEYVVFFKGAET